METRTSEVAQADYEWENVTPQMGLKDGDILRTPMDEKDPTPEWLYGVCSGGGFGCVAFTRGNAIFMRIEAKDPEVCLKYVDNPDDETPGELTPLPIEGVLCRHARWERFFFLQRMVKPPKIEIKVFKTEDFEKETGFKLPECLGDKEVAMGGEENPHTEALAKHFEENGIHVKRLVRDGKTSG